MEMYDLSKEKDGWMNSVELGSDKIPEIADFGVNDEIELHLVCKVKGVREVEKTDNPEIAKETSESGDSKTKNEKPPVKYIKAEMKIVKCGIMNMKEDRKKADELGIEKSSYDKLQAKREARKAASKK